MLIDFVKMQAQGNDFVILDHPGAALLNEDLSALAIAICDRHYGFGADGLVILTNSVTADARMIIYNSDGSRAAMCGSALRCLTRLQSKRTGRHCFELETDSGIKTCRLEPDDVCTVGLGKPQMLDADKQVDEFKGSLVDVGNLHYVVYTNDLSEAPHMLFGARLERHSSFPIPVNVHFARVEDSETITLKIWETGAGATLACGTGATAAVMSGILNHGLRDSVTVRMPGGEVRVSRDLPGGNFELSGKVFHIGTGQFKWKI